MIPAGAATIGRIVLLMEMTSARKLQSSQQGCQFESVPSIYHGDLQFGFYFGLQIPRGMNGACRSKPDPFDPGRPDPRWVLMMCPQAVEAAQPPRGIGVFRLLTKRNT